MKKVITIHINGMLFNMEEDAFSAMRDSLFRHGKQGDKQTESILSEKLTALLSSQKQVITLADIQRILPELGFKINYESSQAENNGVNESYRRIYRSNNQKVLGGVCAGLGKYWDLDPVIIRLIFVVLFFGFGAGLLLYLLMWIIIPVKY